MRSPIPRKTQATRCISLAAEHIEHDQLHEALRMLKAATALIEMELHGFQDVVRFPVKRKINNAF